VFTRETGKSMSAGLIGGSLGCYIGQMLGSDLLTLMLIFPLIAIGYDIRGLARSVKKAAHMSREEWNVHPGVIAAKEKVAVPVGMAKMAAHGVWEDRRKYFGHVLLMSSIVLVAVGLLLATIALWTFKMLVYVALTINTFKRVSMAVFGTLGAAIFLLVNPMAETSPLVMSLVCGIICSVSCGLVSVLLETEERYARAKKFNDKTFDDTVGDMVGWVIYKIFGPVIDSIEARYEVELT
jgi:hypothetical protein